MKKSLLLLVLLLFTLVARSNSEYSPLAWDKWQLWRSPYGVLDLSKGNFLPYSMKTAFFPVKGYNHCKMLVYEANLKFGEITAEDEPFNIFEIDYDDKGRVVKYTRIDRTTFGGKNECIYERDGDKILSESHYNSKGELIGKALYKYDDQNRISVIDLIDKNNRIFKKTKYSYGNNGQTKRSEYNKDGEERCASTDTKDAKGRLIKQTYMEGGSTIVETITYNEYGLIKKINSSKTFVFNGLKDETFKGKLFDEYKYRYDQKGNVVERLALYSHPFGQKYEWIKCDYSNVEEEDIVEEVPLEENGSKFIQRLPDPLLISNNNDRCSTFFLDSLYTAKTVDWDYIRNHEINYDLDKDGLKEGVFLLREEDGKGFKMVVGKKYEEKPTYFTIDVNVEEEFKNQCRISFMFHDFDNDGINEFILAWTDMGMFCNGYVFRWCKPDSKERPFYENTGRFSSSYIPLVEDNTIHTKAGIINSIPKKFVYSNQKLVLEE
jgi:hypothetical protein